MEIIDDCDVAVMTKKRSLNFVANHRHYNDHDNSNNNSVSKRSLTKGNTLVCVCVYIDVKIQNSLQLGLVRVRARARPKQTQAGYGSQITIMASPGRNKIEVGTHLKNEQCNFFYQRPVDDVIDTRHVPHPLTWGKVLKTNVR